MKKMKLISTIASVCLALAVVVFGVYATRIAQVDMSSTISYQVSSNLNIEIVVSVEYNSKTVTYTDTNANTKYVNSGTTASTGFDSINSWKITQGLADEDLNLTGDNALNLGAYAFIAGSANGSQIKYTVTITNKGNYAVQLTKTEPEAVTTGAVTMTPTSTSLTDNQIAGKDVSLETEYSYTFVAIYTLADNSIDLSNSLTFAPSYQLASVSAS